MPRHLEQTTWLDAYLTYTKDTESCALFRKWVGISVIAACLQRKCKIQWGLDEIFPNLYIVLVGPSGWARKGTAMGPGLDMLRKMNIHLSAEATTRESLIRQLKNSITEAYTDNRGVVVDAHNSMTVYSPELTVFLGYDNKQLMSDMTDWYDCRKPWNYITKDEKKTDLIPATWVNLIGATTPDLLQATLTREAVGGGLTSRIIFVYADGPGHKSAMPYEPDMKLRSMLLHDLEAIKMQRGEFKWDDSFIKLYVPWYEQQENNLPFQDERFSAYFSRRPTHARKLAMILNASRDGGMILTDKDIGGAILLLEETEKYMQQCFGGVGRAKNADVADRCLKYLAEVGEAKFSDLLTRYHYDVDRREMAEIISTMVTMKVVEVSALEAGDSLVKIVRRKM